MYCAHTVLRVEFAVTCMLAKMSVLQMRSKRREADDHDDHADEDEHHADEDEHAHDDHDDHEEDGDHQEDLQSKTLTLRIVAVFASAFVTFCGLAVFFNKRSAAISSQFLLCLRAASSGAMISVAVVHILPEAAHELESVTAYPLAGTLVLVGVMVAYAFATLTGGEPHDHLLPLAQSSANVQAPPKMVMMQPQSEYRQGQMMVTGQVQMMSPYGMSVVGTAFGADIPVDVESGKTAITASKLAVESIEFGCVAHSVVLGLTLGLQTDLDSAITLLIVFLLHQTLEAICLSHLIASLENRTEAIVMCIVTTCSMPTGIIIGLIVSYSANATQNTDNMTPITSSIACIAGGMLLYSSLVDIIADDVKRPLVVASAGLRRAMCLSLIVGGSAMSALAAGEVANGEHAHR